MATEQETAEALVRIRVPLEPAPGAPGPPTTGSGRSRSGAAGSGSRAARSSRTASRATTSCGRSRSPARRRRCSRTSIEKGGHRTLRVALDPAIEIADGAIQGLLERLLELGCTHETLRPKLVALDVPRRGGRGDRRRRCCSRSPTIGRSSGSGRTRGRARSTSPSAGPFARRVRRRTLRASFSARFAARGTRAPPARAGGRAPALGEDGHVALRQARPRRERGEGARAVAARGRLPPRRGARSPARRFAAPGASVQWKSRFTTSVAYAPGGSVNATFTRRRPRFSSSGFASPTASRPGCTSSGRSSGLEVDLGRAGHRQVGERHVLAPEHRERGPLDDRDPRSASRARGAGRSGRAAAAPAARRARAGRAASPPGSGWRRAARSPTTSRRYCFTPSFQSQLWYANTWSARQRGSVRRSAPR